MEAHLERVRQDLPAVRATHYLNTGSCGPLPRPAYAAMREALQKEFALGRNGTALWEAWQERQAALRGRIEALIHAPTGSVALTHHTTEGLNLAVGGLDLEAGDEVLTTSLEHLGGYAPIILAARRRGVVPKVVDLGLGEGAQAVERIARALGPRTRLLVVSHVSYATGALLPVREIARLCHERGVWVAVDGAQSVGAVPVDVADLEVDVYALSGQKWLCGPEGTGAVYVRPTLGTALWPLAVGYASFAGEAPSLDATFHADARRYEVGTRYRPAVDGLSASLDWLTGSVGMDWALERIARMAQACRQRLEALDGVRVLTPPGPQAGLISFTVEGWDPGELNGWLESQGIVIRSIAAPPCLRVSTGFFTDEADLEALEEALARALQLRRGA